MGYSHHTATLEGIQRSIRRILLNGPPNSRKTSSLRTLPGHVIIQSYPKEKGTMSIPWRNAEGIPIQSFVWEQIDISRPQNWAQIWEETRQTTIDILTGKKGQCDVFVGDGLHKLYQIILAAVVGGKNFTGEEFDAKSYTISHARFWEYVDLVFNSSVKWVVLTCWDGLELDTPEDSAKGTKASKHVYPDLPGQASKKIMGETSLVLYADNDGAGDSARYFWRTRASGRVWGAGLKLPVDLINKINVPKEVPQDFTALDQLLMNQVTKEWNALQTTMERTGPGSAIDLLETGVKKVLQV